MYNTPLVASQKVCGSEKEPSHACECCHLHTHILNHKSGDGLTLAVAQPRSSMQILHKADNRCNLLPLKMLFTGSLRGSIWPVLCSDLFKQQHAQLPSSNIPHRAGGARKLLEDKLRASTFSDYKVHCMLSSDLSGAQLIQIQRKQASLNVDEDKLGKSGICHNKNGSQPEQHLLARSKRVALTTCQVVSDCSPAACLLLRDDLAGHILCSTLLNCYSEAALHSVYALALENCANFKAPSLPATALNMSLILLLCVALTITKMLCVAAFQEQLQVSRGCSLGLFRDDFREGPYSSALKYRGSSLDQLASDPVQDHLQTQS